MTDTVEQACDREADIWQYERVGLSQRRQSKVCLGLPDRRYRNVSGLFWPGGSRFALWFECKSQADRLSEDQVHFLTAELECGNCVGVGGHNDLAAIFLAYRKYGTQAAILVGTAQVDAWKAKGLRKERPSPAKRRLRTRR